MQQEKNITDFPHHYKKKCFNDIEMSYISETYGALYPHSEITSARFYTEAKQISINGEHFISMESRSKRSSAILCHWPGVIGIDKSGEAPVRVGIVTSFLRHSITMKDAHSASRVSTHVLARVKWLQYHPRQSIFHASAMIVSATVYDNEGPASFVPVSRIISRCALSTNFRYVFDYGEDSVCVAVPLLKKVGPHT